MPSPSWENLDDFLSTDDAGGFAVWALFTLVGIRTNMDTEDGFGIATESGVSLQAESGGQVVSNGIFEDSTLNTATGEYEVDIVNPRFACKASDVTILQRFDTVMMGVKNVRGAWVGGVAYEVQDRPRDDGTGMTVVYLNPAP